MKTIAIIGAGPGLGLSIAKKFGENGFKVALIARNGEKLDHLVEVLQEDGISAAGFPADVLDKSQLTGALSAAKAYFGNIDVLEYSPIPAYQTIASTLDVTEENALYQFQYNIMGAISVVREVLPAMISKNSGALLFTTGASSINPTPMFGNIGLAMAGLRNYVLNLSTELKDKGIYVGHMAIGIWMQEGSDVQDKIADVWFDMYTNQHKVEELITIDMFQ